MTLDEMKNIEIDNYCRLQMIKHGNGGHKNPVLDYQIRQSAVKLQAFGINLDDLEYKEE